MSLQMRRLLSYSQTLMPPRAPKRVGLIGFSGITAFDLIGPLEAFALAAQSGALARPAYEVRIIASSEEPFESESGVWLRAHETFRAAAPFDTLIVPGGAGLRQAETNRTVCAFVEERAAQTRRIASVCTGIYGLAPTRLLDGRRVTTHWRFARDVAERFPRLRVDPNALFLKDGRFYTSAGITAGIDLSLAMIEEDYGPGAALAVAREMVVYLKRPGGQEQYSEPLRFQAQSTSHFGDLVPWMLAHLDRDLRVETLAERVCLSPRQFSRRFKEALGMTPAAFVGILRLDEARRRLSAPECSIEGVAASVGFKSADVFRKAFERRFALTPSAYRGRFNEHPEPFLSREADAAP
jgi:transcriptional regulator GlxA family with amidase domain